MSRHHTWVGLAVRSFIPRQMSRGRRKRNASGELIDGGDYGSDEDEDSQDADGGPPSKMPSRGSSGKVRVAT